LNSARAHLRNSSQNFGSVLHKGITLCVRARFALTSTARVIDKSEEVVFERLYVM
jgi:hypothetical protein